MLIKRFLGNTIQEALQQVKSEIGEDAIILRTRRMRKHWWLGRFSSPLVEVTAATPDHPSRSDDPSTPPLSAVEDLWRKRSTALRWWEIKEEIGELKEQMRMLYDQVRSTDLPSVAPALAPYSRTLIENGVLTKWVGDLTSFLAYQYSGETLQDPQQGRRLLQEAVGEKILTRKVALTSPGRPRVIALVGPTGVGKTTTLAKLVTSYRFWGRSRVALISADTYRVAALEQLKTFAAIAGLPVEAVYQPRAMKPALLRHQTKEAIFIDTAGRSPAEVDKLGELGEFLHQSQPDEILLCLAATTSWEDTLSAIERYRPLGLSGIILTKLDETRQPGNILNLACEVSLPLTFVTVGQNVPDDIFTAHPGYLAKVITDSHYLRELQETRFAAWRRGDGGEG